MKEGLERYAYNPLFTKSQLHRFREEQGLTSNKSNGKLYISFIEKTFRDYRLYFYAGYIYYPEREINTPIKGKQDPLVSLEVIEKIMEKESVRPQRRTPVNLNQNPDEHLLK